VPQPATAVPGAAAPEATGASGPIVYLCDSAGRLGTIDLKTRAVHVIGNLGVVLTDIAFAPSGKLFGVSFGSFYRVNTRTGKATRISALRAAGTNALAFDRAGRSVTASFSRTGLFRIGAAKPFATDGGLLSAGDFAFSGDHMYFSTSNNQLVDFVVDPDSGKPVSFTAHPDGISNLFGLAVTAPGQLYGFANTTLYKLDPSTGHGTLLADFGGKGLGQVFGAAFKKVF
jgi:hypothetical protein